MLWLMLPVLSSVRASGLGVAVGFGVNDGLGVAVGSGVLVVSGALLGDDVSTAAEGTTFVDTGLALSFAVTGAPESISLPVVHASIAAIMRSTSTSAMKTLDLCLSILKPPGA